MEQEEPRATPMKPDGSRETPTSPESGHSTHPNMTDLLGTQLKSAYGELLNAPVPDKILDLVRKLEAAGTKARNDGQNPSSTGGDSQ